MENADATIMPDPFTGGFCTVNPDCTWSGGAMTSLGVVPPEGGTITSEGKFQEMHNIITDEGWIYAETFKKRSDPSVGLKP